MIREADTFTFFGLELGFGLRCPRFTLHFFAGGERGGVVFVFVSAEAVEEVAMVACTDRLFLLCRVESEVVVAFLAFADGAGGGVAFGDDVGVGLALCESMLSLLLLSSLLNTAAAACSQVGICILAITRIL